MFWAKVTRRTNSWSREEAKEAWVYTLNWRPSPFPMSHPRPQLTRWRAEIGIFLVLHFSLCVNHLLPSPKYLLGSILLTFSHFSCFSFYQPLTNSRLNCSLWLQQLCHSPLYLTTCPHYSWLQHPFHDPTYLFHSCLTFSILVTFSSIES